jgi:D-beta-D-heptose 7-phosphate kinase/D-beta-D-heptose 1-phosphate adenosyltransferase
MDPVARTWKGLIEGFVSTRVLVLGDAILDEYLSGDCSRLSPEAPVPVLRVTGSRRTLGGAANTAANVASLGGHAELITLVGTDAAGEELIRLCEDTGIKVGAVREPRSTPRKARVIGQQQQLVRLDFEEGHPIDRETEREVLQRIEERVMECDIVVVSDYAKGFLTRAICERAIGRSHELGKRVIVDPRPQHRDFYRHCDYLTPNWKESQALLGWPDESPSPSRIREAGRALVRELDTNLLLTLGAQGMAFFGREAEDFSVPTEAREVFDVSGAGDTVVAALALALGAGASHVDAVGLANRAAGVVVGKLGTATITPAELADRDEIDGTRLVSRRELAPLAERLRAQGRRIVTLNGSFDLLHAGHLHILTEARRQGDVLIVGVNSDASVRGYKGPGRPIVPEAQRAEMLLALRCVDYVHIFDEAVPMPFLAEIRPAVHVNGAEYGEDCVEGPLVRRLGGRIHLVDRLAGLSSSSLVDRLSGETGASSSQSGKAEAGALVER